jgi:GNAT superfamily N-acetyltransferase
MKIQTKEVGPELWGELERLFGSNGACGGCWCQAWRIAKGERWENIKGTTAKNRLRKAIQAGKALGILAFVDRLPVGWCTFGPRTSFPRLEKARSLQCEDADQVWSIPCFFVARAFREKGVAAALLRHALRVMKKRKVRIVEGYPSKPDNQGRYIAAFSWTGTRSLFRKAGFRVAGNPEGAKQRVRKDL